MEVTVDQILQIHGELAIKFRLLEEENERLQQELAELRSKDEPRIDREPVCGDEPRPS
jgi:hypothetical protein